LPIIRRGLPDIGLSIVGSDPPEALHRLRSRRVAVTGHVPHVASYFEAARVFVAPLRYGAGVKGKIAHAMEHRLPVVTTTVGAEGMHLVHEESCPIADTAGDFAAAVIRLYNDEDL